MQNNYKERPARQTERDTQAEKSPKTETAEEKKPTVGIVTDCTSLYVRKEPSREADHAAIIKAMDCVEVLEEGSTEDFYKVKTQDGAEGYCMKKFIALRK